MFFYIQNLKYTITRQNSQPATQIKMDIMYQKAGFKRMFNKFLIYKYTNILNNHLICFERDDRQYLIKMLENFQTQHKFVALNTYLLSLQKQIRC